MNTGARLRLRMVHMTNEGRLHAEPAFVMLWDVLFLHGEVT